MPQDEVMERVTAVQVKYIDELMQKKYVVGVAIGLAQKDGLYTDEMAVVVMVEQKVPEDELEEADLVPKQLEDVRVDVQATGAFTADGLTGGLNAI